MCDEEKIDCTTKRFQKHLQPSEAMWKVGWSDEKSHNHSEYPETLRRATSVSSSKSINKEATKKLPTYMPLAATIALISSDVMCATNIDVASAHRKVMNSINQNETPPCKPVIFKIMTATSSERIKATGTPASI